MKNENDKQTILEQIKDELTRQVPAPDAAQATFFGGAFFRRVPVAELAGQSPARKYIG